MRKILRTLVALAFVAGMSLQGVATERGDRGRRGDRPRTEQRGDRRGGHHGGGHDNGNHNGHRPGKRPGGYSHNRPTPPPRHHHGPSYRPTPPPPPHHHYGYAYVPSPWGPPPPPPRVYRRYAVVPSFTNILGVTLGMAFDYGLNALVNSGYTVSGYGNNMINLTNVYNLNYMWPDATLYFGNGGFCGGTFVDYSTYYDMSRYNGVYSYLTQRYGPPVSVSNNGSVVSGTWYGDGGRFVTLTYTPFGAYYQTQLTYGL